MLRSGSPTFRHSGQSSPLGCRGPKQHTPRRSRDTFPVSIQELRYLYSLHHRLHRGCHHYCGPGSPHPSGVEGLPHASALHTLHTTLWTLNKHQRVSHINIWTTQLSWRGCYLHHAATYVNVEEIPLSDWDLGTKICAVHVQHVADWQ